MLLDLRVVGEGGQAAHSAGIVRNLGDAGNELVENLSIINVIVGALRHDEERFPGPFINRMPCVKCRL